MASWRTAYAQDSDEEESSLSEEERKTLAGNYMDMLQESYCSSDDNTDEVQSKENI